MAEQRGASGSTDFPLSSERDRAWIANEADARVRKWASSDGSGAKDKMDWTKYASTHFWVDPSNKTNFTGYKLGFVDIVGGNANAIWHAVTACAAIMQGGRGGVDVPAADVPGIKRKIEAYYAKARSEFNDDSIKVPWAADSSSSSSGTKAHAAETMRMERLWRKAEIRLAPPMPTPMGPAMGQPTMDPSQCPIYEMSLSDETPVQRFFGQEILLHGPSNVRMQRINAGAPLLFNHSADRPVGMVVPGSARLCGDKKVRAAVQFFPTEAGQEVRSMVDSGLRNTSVGYDIYAVKELPAGDGFQATDWEPVEASFAPVPAVTAVGFSRSAPNTEHEVIVTRSTDDDSATAVRDARSRQPAAFAATTKGVAMSDGTTAAAAGNAEGFTQQFGRDGATEERLRISTIDSLCRRNYGPYKPSEEDRARWISEGKTADEVSQVILDQISQRTQATVKEVPSQVGLSNEEVKRYSVTRAIRACVEKSWPKVAPFEAEVSQAIGRRMGRQASEYNFYVPLEVQQARHVGHYTRDVIAGTTTMGGFLVGTQVTGFIDLLRNRSAVMRLGATMLPGLTGSVSIPKLTGASTAYWFADETGTATESQPTFGQLALTPKTVGGYVEVSRQLLLQTAYNADQIINGDLAKTIGLAVDLAAISGTGGTQPQGVIGLTGVGTSNPATGTAVSYADMISFQSAVATANAMMPGFAYLATPEVAGILMSKPRFTNSDTPIWQGNILDGTMIGAPAMSSMQMSTGRCLGGDFSQIVIGEWGVLEIEANPYAQFQSGIVGIRALYTVDVGVRQASAFSLGTGITG